MSDTDLTVEELDAMEAGATVRADVPVPGPWSKDKNGRWGYGPFLGGASYLISVWGPIRKASL